MSTVYIYEWTDVNDVWQTLVQTIPGLNHRKACLYTLHNELYVQWCIFIEPFFSALHQKGQRFTSGCVPSCFVAQNLWRCIWMRNTGRRPNELLRISTLIAPRWEKQKHQQPIQPTKFLVNYVVESGWFGVVRMDDLMAFWHEFDVNGFLVMFVEDWRCLVFFCESNLFWRLSDKGNTSLVDVFQLAQLITITWLWFGEWYSTLSIYPVLLCHVKSFKPMHCTRLCSRFA